jgi:hypothetical protein
MDLGLGRDHPELGLDALTDGVELTLDLGVIDDRTFVNNASFGAYAEIVQSPAYRADKLDTTLQMLPDLLSGRRGPRLVGWIDDDVRIEGPTALLISNNPYDLKDLAGLGRRARLDSGVLGVVAITVDSAAQAAALMRQQSSGLRTLTAHEVVIDADADEIPVGIHGGVGADADPGALPDPPGSAAGTRAARPPDGANTHGRQESGPCGDWPSAPAGEPASAAVRVRVGTRSRVRAACATTRPALRRLCRQRRPDRCRITRAASPPDGER